MTYKSSSAMGDYWFEHSIYGVGEARYLKRRITLKRCLKTYYICCPQNIICCSVLMSQYILTHFLRDTGINQVFYNLEFQHCKCETVTTLVFSHGSVPAVVQLSFQLLVVGPITSERFFSAAKQECKNLAALRNFLSSCKSC